MSDVKELGEIGKGPEKLKKEADRSQAIQHGTLSGSNWQGQGKVPDSHDVSKKTGKLYGGQDNGGFHSSRNILGLSCVSIKNSWHIPDTRHTLNLSTPILVLFFYKIQRLYERKQPVLL